MRGTVVQMVRTPPEREGAGGRLEVLDGLRFVAALAVLLYHYTTLTRTWHRLAHEIFPQQPGAYGWLGVYLFFLISGFVICMSSWGRGVGRFVLSRAVRLYPAYWLSVVAVAVVLTVWPPYHRKPVGWQGALVNLTMLHEPLGVRPVAQVYWSLWVELRFYLLFALLVWWGLTYRRVVAFCLVWLGAVTVTKAAANGGLAHEVLMPNYAPLFTAGVAFYLMYRFGPTLLSWAIVAASFALSVPAVLYRARLEDYPNDPAPPSWPAVVLLAACFLLIAAVALGGLRRVRGRWLVVLGATSYPLYLIHADIGGTMLYVWQWSVPPPLLVVMVTVVVVLLAWLVHRYVERPVAPLVRRALLSMPAVIRRRPGGAARRLSQEA